MQGKIDTSFQTVQRDLFSSGLAAKVGMNAFGVWLAIKSHADYNSGVSWPGMRRLAEVTGLSLASIHKSVQVLIEQRLLRVTPGKGKKTQQYVARERLDVSLGDRVLCTIILDYVPATLRQKISQIDAALRVGEPNPDVWADCEIIPGQGFEWDASSGSLRGKIKAEEIPSSAFELDDGQVKNELQRKVLAIRDNKKTVA